MIEQYHGQLKLISILKQQVKDVKKIYKLPEQPSNDVGKKLGEMYFTGFDSACKGFEEVLNSLEITISNNMSELMDEMESKSRGNVDETIN